MERSFDLGFDLPTGWWLGLATRGNTHLDPEDVHHAVDRGENSLNWCGYSDDRSCAISEMVKETAIAW
ncbi:TPA: hypothetical protein DCE37_07165 [Candidatus Latescibacteria bacterium]|nr:hypothetical protein [Candidatus Latescibacterota bacterium]|tara:strand:- start:373 stop:576 length:204 start_codon:yes stop_codon:yes gene_type:complete